MLKKLPALILLAAAALPLAGLEPPDPGELERYLRDGSLAWRLANARALGNHIPDAALLAAFRARLERLRRLRGGRAAEILQGLLPATVPSSRRGLPTKGSVKIFALLLSFPDYPWSQSRDLIDSKLFGPGLPAEWPYESLRAYYQRSSYGLLDIGGATLGWYQAPFTRAGMPMTGAARESLIKQALTYYDGLGHDFAQYDNDGNGVIDYFVVIWTGPDNGWANFWWGYQTSFGDGSFRLDGKTFGGAKYSWQWESRPYPGTFRPYVVMHETGHALGLPDYYDYDASVGPRGGLGGLDMMDANAGDHNAFSKMLLDWLTPQVFNIGTRSFLLRATAFAPEAAILMPEFSTAQPFDEFFIIQNRARSQNDAYLPGDGLLIWHVDARLNAAGNNFAWDNSYTEHKLLRLMEADGQEHIEKGYASHAADYYVPGRELRPTGTPNSGRYDGSISGLSVYAIGPPGPAESFTAGIDYPLLPPADLALRRLESDYVFFRESINQLSWAPEPHNRTRITSIRILRKPRGAPESAYSLLAELDPAQILYEDRGLRSGDFYDYRVILTDANGVVSRPGEVGN